MDCNEKGKVWFLDPDSKRELIHCVSCFEGSLENRVKDANEDLAIHGHKTLTP